MPSDFPKSSPAPSRSDRSCAVVLTHTRVGLQPTLEGLRRLDAAKALWQDGRVERILISGGLPDPDGHTMASTYAQALTARGVPHKAVFLETRSRDTAENLYFVQPILLRWWLEGFQRVILVSNHAHLARARLTWDFMEGWAGVSLECHSSHHRLPCQDRWVEALFRAYAHLDPGWHSALAEHMRQRRVRQYLCAKERRDSSPPDPGPLRGARRCMWRKERSR